MQKQNLRLMVAADRSSARNLSPQVSQMDGSATVLGGAGSYGEASTLARGAKPDELSVAPNVAIPFANHVLYFGGLGFLLGGATMFTVVFAPVGVVIAVAGVCAILFGLTSKLINRIVAGVHLSKRV